MKGDWVQAKYFVNPTQWTTQANSVAPLRYSRLDQVMASLNVFNYTHSIQFIHFFSTSVALLKYGIVPNSDEVVMIKCSFMSVLSNSVSLLLLPLNTRLSPGACDQRLW